MLPDDTSMTHAHTPDVDFAAETEHLHRRSRLWAEVTALVAAELPLPSAGSGGTDAVVADIGSGAGEQAVAMAVRGARVYAVDREPVLLDAVRRRAEAAGVADRVRLVEADLDALPDALPERVHLTWAGHVVHHVGDQTAALRRLAATLLPAGVLAVAEGGRAPRGLPWDVGVGDPGLEGRLDAAHERWFAAMRSGLPGHVREPYGWSAMLRAAGLVDVTARAWLLHRPAPLGADDRAVLLDGLVGRVERAGRWLADDDLAAWRRLLDEGDPAWLGHRDDLEVLAVTMVHLGRRP
jgi:SAM-dependent methyltransferase